MLLKAEFDENMSNLERSVDDMLAGGEGKILILILAPLQYNGLARIILLIYSKPQ